MWDRWQRGELMRSIGRGLASRLRQFISNYRRSEASVFGPVDALGWR